MAKFILRVDDCGWNPDKGDDRGLEYFRRWRDAAGLEGLPVYYGFIPVTVSLRETDWLAKNLKGGECVAVHGYDHADGAVLSADEMWRGHRMLGLSTGSTFGGHWPSAYIPPFNRYDLSVVKQWSEHIGRSVSFASARPESFFFGGFPDDQQSINLGTSPTVVDYTIHLPAYRPLYDRAATIYRNLPGEIERADEIPRVVTLHCTWDVHDFYHVGLLVDMLRPHLVDCTAARDWIERVSGGRR